MELALELLRPVVTLIHNRTPEPYRKLSLHPTHVLLKLVPEFRGIHGTELVGDGDEDGDCLAALWGYLFVCLGGGGDKTDPKNSLLFTPGGDTTCHEIFSPRYSAEKIKPRPMTSPLVPVADVPKVVCGPPRV